MQALYDKLKSNPIVYVTRDIERALGLETDTEGYFIISNSTAFAKSAARDRTNILLIAADKLLSTAELLQNKAAQDFIMAKNNPSILVFKNTKQIARIVKDNGWSLLNPPAELGDKIEEKISQVELLKNLGDLFLKYKILKCKDIKWEDKKFILQFGHSHTGGGTHLIDTEKRLNEITRKFPERVARVAEFVRGPLFTNNNVINNSSLIMGNISYQITGLEPFTQKAFATVGNDWGLARAMLTPNKHLENYKTIIKAVAAELRKLGWKGLFGVDIILDTASAKMHLIEINARQPASATFESWLQRKKEKTAGITTFEAHLAALLGVDSTNEHWIEIDKGAQIIQRVLGEQKINCPINDISANLRHAGFYVIEYDNTDTGEELLRIQSDNSIMDNHNKLNRDGEKIVNLICSSKNTLSSPTRALIEGYISLAIGGKKISCPYFNNARTKTRGGLRIFTGKGSVKEIKEEIKILAKKEKINLSSLNEEQIKQFLIERNIGIDCSGFVYHALDTELKARGKFGLSAQISFAHIKNILRRLIAKLRPAQNTDVLTFAQSNISRPVKLTDIKPADIIVMIKGGTQQDRNHILLVEAVRSTAIDYVHSFAWSTDGKYNHGVSRGKLEIINPTAGLLAQKWIEKNKTGEENETYARAKEAQILEIRRLNTFE